MIISQEKVEVNQIMKMNQMRYLKQKVKLIRFLKFFEKKRIKKRKLKKHTNFGRINITQIKRKRVAKY